MEALIKEFSKTIAQNPWREALRAGKHPAADHIPGHAFLALPEADVARIRAAREKRVRKGKLRAFREQYQRQMKIARARWVRAEYARNLETRVRFY